jgi:hypothetical protein
MLSADRVLGIEVGERLPTATETDDLDIVLAAAVRNRFYGCVEARDVAAASENANALSRHENSESSLTVLEPG